MTRGRCTALRPDLQKTLHRLAIIPYTEPTLFFGATFLFDMGDQSSCVSSRALFQSALEAYKKTTGISLVEHPLTLQLQNCRSVESAIALLQNQIRVSSDFGENERLKGSVTSIISILSGLSATAALDWGLVLVRQKVLMVCSTIPTVLCRHSHLKMQYSLVSQSYLPYVPFRYLRHAYRCDVQVHQATKGIDSGYDALVDLFESVARFLKRLAIYTQIPYTTALDEVLVRILMELLSTFALATKALEHGRSSESVLVDVLKLLNGMQRG